MTRVELSVKAGERGIRLEDLLSDRFRALSKMYLREVVKNGACEVNGRHENIGYKLRPADFIEIELDLTREHSMLPQNIPLEIVHEDADLILVVKPAGMLVHPSHREKNGTLLNALTFHFNQNGGPMVRPGLIHRLDKGTSGLIVVAKNARAHTILCRQFQRKTVEKLYLALVEGDVEAEEGTILGNIGRHAELKFWSLKEDGKPSESRYRVRERANGRTLLELEPVTGRTNQLRIQCASIGHPIVGDIERGGPKHSRLCLHAARLGFRHPSTNESVAFESEPDFSVPARNRAAELQT
jgi:23S rRNA pseudouridine1911/1915/1917 synthase